MLYFQTAPDVLRAFETIEAAQECGCAEFPQLTQEEAVDWSNSQVKVPPSPAHRQSEMRRARDNAQHYELMGDTTQAAAWRSYYRELHALEQAPGWPLAPQWPTAPELAA